MTHPGTDDRMDRPDVLDALRAWLPGRRWFPGGPQTTVEPVVRVDLPCDEPDVRVVVQVLRALSPGRAPVVLQVPLVLDSRTGGGSARSDGRAPGGQPGSPVGGRPGGPRPAEPDGLVAVLSDGRLVDGPAHPAFVAAWLAGATWAGSAPTVPRPFDLRGQHVLTGEQSNTSVLLPHVAGGAMLKILRALGPGQNPDVVVPLALTDAGWTGVPVPYAWTELTVTEPTTTGGGSGAAPPVPEATSAWTGHSGVLAELVPQARDGFELACELARDGRPFANQARELGTQVAQMHGALRRAFPADVHDADPAWLLGAMQRRVRSAASASAAVRSRLPEIEAFLVRMQALADEAGRQGRPLPPVQRIHGDLHLGQALYSPRTGWRILDFEGEPLRPVAERTRPDLGERDVAGMLRSFDYASAVGGATSTEWARGARRAFLEGYTGYLSVPGALGFGRPPSLADRVVVRDAFELDKALYEVVYEERSRPGWISIPLAAVDRILDSVTTPAQAGR